ncbi:hypothetical protein [Promicromonospora sukumoe]
MTLSPWHGARATASRYALVLLLALAGLLGLATPGTAAPEPHVVTTQHHVDVRADDGIVAASDDCPAHGGQHGADTAGLLGLRAPLVTGSEPAVCAPAAYRVVLPPLLPAGAQVAQAHTLARALGHDPVLWGISRT